jgi:hypothetical protein
MHGSGEYHVAREERGDTCLSCSRGCAWLTVPASLVLSGRASLERRYSGARVLSLIRVSASCAQLVLAHRARRSCIGGRSPPSSGRALLRGVFTASWRRCGRGRCSVFDKQQPRASACACRLSLRHKPPSASKTHWPRALQRMRLQRVRDQYDDQDEHRGAEDEGQTDPRGARNLGD